MTEAEKKFSEIRRATAERLRGMTPQERDQVMQIHLAAAMSPRARFQALAGMTALVLALRRGKESENAEQDGGESVV